MAATREELFGILGCPEHTRNLTIADGKLGIVVRGMSFSEQMHINRLASLLEDDSLGVSDEVLVLTIQYGVHEPCMADPEDAERMYRKLSEEDVSAICDAVGGCTIAKSDNPENDAKKD